jgi:hypothetical protein
MNSKDWEGRGFLEGLKNTTEILGQDNLPELLVLLRA